jgi:hypothetical protein
MSVEQRIRDAERSLFGRYNLTVDESFVGRRIAGGARSGR